MKKKYIYFFLVMFAISATCFFIDPHFPKDFHMLKLGVWLMFSPGTLLYVGPDFILVQFITSMLANIIWSIFLAFIYSIFDKRKK